MAGGFPVSSLVAPKDRETSGAVRKKMIRILFFVNVGSVAFVGAVVGVYWGCGVIKPEDYRSAAFIVGVIMVALTLLFVPVSNVLLVRKYTNKKNSRMRLDSDENWGKVGANVSKPALEEGLLERRDGKKERQEAEEKEEERSEQEEQHNSRRSPPKFGGNKVAPTAVITDAEALLKIAVVRPGEEYPDECHE
jgi:hypothetical protein